MDNIENVQELEAVNQKSKTEKVKEWFSLNKALLIKCFIFTFALGLIAHGFGFFNLNLSHDSLGEFGISVYNKLANGRFLHPVIRFILGENVVFYWLDGIISLIFLSLSAFFICKAFKIEKTLPIIIITGILTTNTAMTALIATFMHDLVAFTLSELIACYCFYFYVSKRDKFKIWHGAVIGGLIILIGGLYQGNLTVLASLTIIYSIVQLINGEKCKDELVKLAWFVLYVIIGVLVYVLISFGVSKIYGSGLYSGEQYNSWDALLKPLDILKRVPYAYFNFIATYFIPTWHDAVRGTTLIHEILVCVINAALIISCLIIVVKTAIENKYTWQRWVFLIALVIALPIVIFAIYIFTGTIHTLVTVSTFSVYILVIEILRAGKDKLPKFKFNKFTTAITCLILVIVACNVSISNTCYVKKDLEGQATLSYMTRVVDRIEDENGYVAGETEVMFMGFGVFDGMLGDDVISKNNLVSYIIGMQSPNAITYYSGYKAYFQYVMHYDINLSKETKMLEFKEKQEVKDMAVFPSADSVKYIDGVLVIKLSNI